MKPKDILIYLLFLVLMGSCKTLRVQADPPRISLSGTIEYSGNLPYFSHYTGAGQTLFSIARAYHVSENLIREANPDLASGLRAGQTIRIPAFGHIVQQGETEFGLSRRFGLSLQELRDLNPKLTEYGLRLSDTLFIPGRIQPEAGLAQTPPSSAPAQTPQQITPAAESTISMPLASHRLPCGDARLKSVYHVALLIPLYLEEVHLSGGFDSSVDEIDVLLDLQHKSFSFLPYYHGVMLALDSIIRQGTDIRLHVYDVCQDMTKARGLVQRGELKNMDLIIGPFFGTTLDYIAQHARTYNIPVVSPLLSDNNQLRNAPNLFMATPSLQSQLVNMAAYIGRTYRNENIILVHNNQPGAVGVIQAFREALSRSLGRSAAGENGNNPAVFREVIYNTAGIAGLTAQLHPTKKNVLITLISGEAFLSNYLRELSHRSRTHSFVLFGIPEWMQYQSLDLDYLHTLNAHMFAPAFTDYEKPANIEFIRKYREAFRTEPNADAFKAVETAYYFFKALSLYGTGFPGCMEQIEKQSADASFRFVRTMGASGGWENSHSFLYRFEGFRVIQLQK